MNDVTTDNLAELGAELEVLELFDLRRRELENDRGKGSRSKELSRRRLELEPYDRSSQPASAAELLEVAERLRDERAEGSSDENVKAWRGLVRDLKAAAAIDDERRIIATIREHELDAGDGEQ